MAQDYFERDLSGQETDALFEAMNESFELRDSFMTAARDEWLLNHALHLQQATVQPVRGHHSFRHRARRIAALFAIFITLATVFVADRVRVNLAIPSAGVQLFPLAKVVDFYVMENDVISLVNHGRVRVLTAETQLNDGDRIVVPPGARLTFRYLNERTSVSVTGNTLLSVSQHQGGKMIRLNRGHLEAKVDKQDPKTPMRVVTDDAEAVVLGTTFEISALEYTHLAVHSGCVRLKSFLNNKSVDVSSGELVSSFDMTEKGNVSFEQIELIPVVSKTLNNPVYDQYLIVDDDRDYTTFLAFDVGNVSGRIIEAKLQLRAVDRRRERGGEGTFRLYRLRPGASPDQPASFGVKQQVAYFQGQVDHGVLLEMNLDPEQLQNGINNFELSLDDGGNDCWFTPVESKFPPRMILKVRKE